MTIQESADNATDVARDVASILLDEDAVLINVGKPFVYASGTVSPIYCDLRLLMRSPAARRRIVDLLAERMLADTAGSTIDVVAGVATAGIPWAAWVAEAMGKPMAYARDAAKGHGRGQQVEGGVTSGQSAFVVEDLTSTGGSALAAVEGLRELGARADHSLSVFTYEFAHAKEAYQAAGVQYSSLCNITTLLGIATASGKISADDERAVRQWLESGPMTARPGA